MKKYFNQWKESRLKDKIEIICILFGASAAVFGAVTGYWALNEYKTTNKITMSGQLQTVDREIASLTFSQPNLSALWTIVPDSLHGKDKADELLKAFLHDRKNKIKISGSTWGHVRDLEAILWSKKNLHNKEMHGLRNGYTFAESILYLVCSAIDAGQRDQLSPEDVKTYVAYLNDVGAHPLFLHALWFGHRGGYFSPKVAEQLQKELLKNEEAKEMIGCIYIELLDEKKWPLMVGKSK